MTTEAQGILEGLWYLAALSREVRRGAMMRRILFGEPVVVGRTAAGAAFALRDVCPHRAAPLSAGRVTGDAVECPYHAWTFSVGDGRCVSIPALPSNDVRDSASIRVARYTLHEANGLIWIWYGEGAPGLAPPDIGLPGAFLPKTTTVVETSGPFDEAVVGLVDPAHTPTVHKQWWWREGAPRADKAKAFEPTALGFKMIAHAPSSNSLIYKAIGGAPVTEIEFRLPALRLEHVRTNDRRILALTAMTPGEAGVTRIVHLLYWDFAVFDLVQPLAQLMANDFLKQDGDILRLQNENMKRLRHRPLYLGDADEPAKWYFALKRSWDQRGPQGFVNPLGPSILRWRT
ncbi:MAG: aromatic ring-hydroxylating dioxygenase subunit alpha [Parvularculaceae bacterium]|nr:aromatic ring-hydroxylating dioxygenase subunit alpha [Parvularculaceae bacterium]